MRTINNIHSISADAQKSIKAFFYDFSKFMEENFSATPDQLMLDWNCVGATAQFHSRNNYFEFQLWECSEGYLDIPDMTAIVSVFSTTTEEMAAITGNGSAKQPRPTVSVTSQTRLQCLSTEPTKSPAAPPHVSPSKPFCHARIDHLHNEQHYRPIP